MIAQPVPQTAILDGAQTCEFSHAAADPLGCLGRPGKQPAHAHALIGEVFIARILDPDLPARMQQGAQVLALFRQNRPRNAHALPFRPDRRHGERLHARKPIPARALPGSHQEGLCLVVGRVARQQMRAALRLQGQRERRMPGTPRRGLLVDRISAGFRAGYAGHGRSWRHAPPPPLPPCAACGQRSAPPACARVRGPIHAR